MTDSNDNGDIRRELRAFLTMRRTDINPAYRSLAKFSRDTGVNYKTLQRIESKSTRHRFSSGTLLELDRAYQLPPGTIERALEGSNPPTIEIARLPDPPGRPPVEDTEPHIRLRGTPTLNPGEELTAWRMDDGRLHCRYTHGEDVLTAPVPGSITVEEIVKRMRMMADLAGM